MTCVLLLSACLGSVLACDGGPSAPPPPPDETFDGVAFTAALRAALTDQGGAEEASRVVGAASVDHEVRVSTDLLPGIENVVAATFICETAVGVARSESRQRLRVDAADGTDLARSAEAGDGWWSCTGPPA